MAHPGQLVETIASALGVPRQTVVQHDRQLAAKGYRRKGGRGRSAIRITPEDAANLLIAVAAAPVSGPAVKETVGTFEKYASLPAWKSAFHEQPGDWSELKVLSELSKGHSLSEALAALIRGYARGDFASSDLVWRKSPSGESGEVDVIVTLEGPIPTARIDINSYRGKEIPERDHVELNYRRKLPATKTGFALRKRGEVGDLVQVRAFSDYTLKTVAALFADSANAQGKT